MNEGVKYVSETGRLDRKRSYGTVYNDPNIGFVQDEKYYRHDGYLYVPPDPLLSGLKMPDKDLEGSWIADVSNVALTGSVGERLDSALAERTRKKT
jgi:hypothetical protein